MTNATHPLYRRIRRSLGLSLREVSRRTGINPGRLSIIERGVEPTPAEAAAIESVLLRAVVPVLPSPSEA